jgi:hypothetical protein
LRQADHVGPYHRAFCHGGPKTREWRAPVPQSAEKFS